MILDVGPLLRGEVDSIKIDYMLQPQKLDGVTFNGDAHVLGEITDNAGYMRLTLKAELSYSSECARCLAPVNGVFSLDFERTVVSEGTISDEQLDEHFDEYAILDKTMLDIDEPLSEEMLLSFPAKLLCSEDCPGLCPKCGKPKREGKCECPEREIDPRWAALKTFCDEDKK
ncbi:MAG: DUF177 domain-containing protein [Clostridia bacterium]|nr:DUF177 domain-containing protein [Clostridia bacterium]